MTIEKLQLIIGVETIYTPEIVKFVQPIYIKINELIDAHLHCERNRSEQMSRIVDELEKLKNRIIELEIQSDKTEEKQSEILSCPFC